METRQLPSLRTAILCGLGAAALTAAIALPFIGRYGWDRDELYYLSAAKHLSFGYVDFLPLAAVFGWPVQALAGNSLIALRLTGLACGMASVVLVALMVRELGGRPRAQLGGAVAWALTPFVLGSASIFHPTFFDLLAWTAFLHLALRILARPEPRLWPLLGLNRRHRLRGQVHDPRPRSDLPSGIGAHPLKAVSGQPWPLDSGGNRGSTGRSEPCLAACPRLAQPALPLQPERRHRRRHLEGRIPRRAAPIPRRRPPPRRRRGGAPLARPAPAGASAGPDVRSRPLPDRARPRLLPDPGRRPCDRRRRGCGRALAGARGTAAHFGGSAPLRSLKSQSSCSSLRSSSRSCRRGR